MRTIKCRKCGAEIDASLGECPRCGALYYILPPEPEEKGFDMTLGPGEWIKESPKEAEPAPAWTPSAVDEPTRVWKPAPGEGQVWKASGAGAKPAAPRPEEAGPAGRMPPRPAGAENPRPAPPQPGARRPENAATPAVPPRRGPEGGGVRAGREPVTAPEAGAERRPAQKAPEVPPARRAPEGPGPRRKSPPPPPEKPRGSFAKTYIILALGVLAVLTVVLCYMAGVFDFDKKAGAGEMPYVVGQTVESAEAILEDLGLTVKTVQAPSDRDEGIVIEQSIPKGQKLSGRETVTLTVSGGEGDAPATASPEPTGTLITVPGLRGQTYDAAKQTLMALGLNLQKSGEEYSATVAEGLILSQSPEGSTSAKAGDTIYVVLSKGPEPPPAYTVTVTAGKGGSVSPTGQVSVEEGDSKTFTITPDEGYEIREVKVDGVSVGAAGTYTFEDVTSNHTLYAVFQLAPTPTPTAAPTEAPSPTPSDGIFEA